jgi:hypothetical protein
LTRSDEADIRSDLYSLGCTFYFLLTGRPSFQATTDMEKLYKHWFEEPQPVERWRSEVPANISAVVGRLLDKRPGERYQTPQELAEALGPFSQSEGAADGSRAGERSAAAWEFGSAVSSDSVGEVRRFEGHGSRVLDVALTPDGKRAVSGGWDRNATAVGPGARGTAPESPRPYRLGDERGVRAGRTLRPLRQRRPDAARLGILINSSRRRSLACRPPGRYDGASLFAGMN